MLYFWFSCGLIAAIIYAIDKHKSKHSIDPSGFILVFTLGPFGLMISIAMISLNPD